MKPARLWRWLAALVAVVLLAPIWILWCPGAARWRAHAYCTLLYGQTAQRIVGHDAPPSEAITRVADYVQTHLWTPGWAAPFDGTPVDHLLRGIGWCDDQARSYAALLATLRIPARYAMLLEADGTTSPHTVAEVWDGGRWGVHDLTFGLRLIDPHGEPLTLEQLAGTPALLDAQPALIALRRLQPDLAQSVHDLYARVLPLAVPPRRSHAGTQRLTVFDHLLLVYARLGGPRFVAWYQDRYLATPFSRATTPDARLTLARHWHLAGRSGEATQGYLRCAREAAGSPTAADARFWLGVLEWEDGHPAAAAQTFQTLLTEEPNSRWTPMAWYYMGRSFEALGDRRTARAWYLKAGGSGPVAWSRLVHLALTFRTTDTW